MGILLDPKYGVNPSVYQCYFCGEDIGVALFGRLKNGKEAPRKCGVINKEPCDKCADLMKSGVMLIETSDMPSNGEEPYRTGKMVIIKHEAFNRIFKVDVKSPYYFIHTSVWQAVGIDQCSQ